MARNLKIDSNGVGHITSDKSKFRATINDAFERATTMAIADVRADHAVSHATIPAASSVMLSCLISVLQDAGLLTHEIALNHMTALYAATAAAAEANEARAND